MSVSYGIMQDLLPIITQTGTYLPVSSGKTSYLAASQPSFTIKTPVDAPITESGLVWATTTNPTTANSKYSAGTGSTFTSVITGLTAGNFYYVRAFATNKYGTAYKRVTVQGTLASNANPGIASRVNAPSTKTITASGSQTFPVGTYRITTYLAVGGGGGGGSAQRISSNCAGGGGGGGNSIYDTTARVYSYHTIGANNNWTFTATIGAGGNPGTMFGSGGGSTSIGTDWTYAQAGGGSGGGGFNGNCNAGQGGLIGGGGAAGVICFGAKGTGSIYSGAAGVMNNASGGGGGAGGNAGGSGGGVGIARGTYGTFGAGGNGMPISLNNPGGNGTANTGNGGGGASKSGTNGTNNGGTGGSGKLVIVSD
jgi:hypothetical protein